jgi:hypothetical protein
MPMRPKRLRARIHCERLEGRDLPAAVIFQPPPPLPPAMVGRTYRFDFCNQMPARPIGNAGTPARLRDDRELCGVPDPKRSGAFSRVNPTGGQPPYYFTLGSGVGFPPINVFLDKNGLLEGKPRVPGNYTFQVCAVDLGGNQQCQTVSLQVNPAQTRAPARGGRTIVAGTWEGPITFDDSQCTLTGTIHLSFDQVGTILTGNFDLQTSLAVDKHMHGLCPPSRSASGILVGSAKGTDVSLTLEAGNQIYGGGTIQGHTIQNGHLFGLLGDVPTNVTFSLTQITHRRPLM